MLKRQKRLTKRQIKEDKFVTFYFKAQDYLKQNSRAIMYGIGVAVLIILAGFIYSKKQAEKEASAVVELTKAKLAYFENDYAKAIPILKDLVENYGGSRGSNEGLFYLANAYYELKNYVNAERRYKQFLGKGNDDILLSSAMSGIAACLEQQKNYAVAAKMYREAAEKYNETFVAPQNLYAAARCYALAGESEEARRLLNQIIENHSNSSLKSDAEVLLAELLS